MKNCSKIISFYHSQHLVLSIKQKQCCQHDILTQSTISIVITPEFTDYKLGSGFFAPPMSIRIMIKT